MKIIINRDYGGFSFSRLALLYWVKLKGYPYVFSNKWAVASENPPEWNFLDGSKYLLEERYNLFYKDPDDNMYKILEGYEDFLRTDSLMIEIVEDLKKEANGNSANLKIVEIPDKTWYITNYDGKETVRQDAFEIN